jgi:hypothetical protein
MKMIVDTMQSEFKFGNIRELRGNFKEITRETDEGLITEYECDYFRTTGNETFEELFARHRVPGLKDYLKSTDWIHMKCAEEGLDVSVEYPDIVQKRIQTRDEINNLEQYL